MISAKKVETARYNWYEYTNNTRNFYHLADIVVPGHKFDSTPQGESTFVVTDEQYRFIELMASPHYRTIIKANGWDLSRWK